VFILLKNRSCRLIKSFAKRALHGLGYDVRRFNPAGSEASRLDMMLKAHDVNLIFDVGANTGQFARSLRELGYRGRIVSFEPLSEAWEKLQDAARTDRLWEIAPRGAIGAEDGEIEFHVSGNLVSSSVLGILDSHLKIAPESKYVRSECVPLRRLDAIGASFVKPDSRLFIKLDAQGYEHEVLKGATGLLSRAVGLHLEILFVPLYEGQHSYDELILESKGLGFEMWDLRSGIVDQNTGRMLWGDAVFFRD
jgi:FkbM family methyltransferase